MPLPMPRTWTEAHTKTLWSYLTADQIIVLGAMSRGEPDRLIAYRLEKSGTVAVELARRQIIDKFSSVGQDPIAIWRSCGEMHGFAVAKKATRMDEKSVKRYESVLATRQKEVSRSIDIGDVRKRCSELKQPYMRRLAEKLAAGADISTLDMSKESLIAIMARLGTALGIPTLKRNRDGRWLLIQEALRRAFAQDPHPMPLAVKSKK